jgi:hypothetical protein
VDERARAVATATITWIPSSAFMTLDTRRSTWGPTRKYSSVTDIESCRLR